MAEQKYPNGARVRLRSGGPTMTVVTYAKFDYEQEESYKCRWFNDKNLLQEGIFTEPELERMD